jgi:hypothetical protein
MAADISFGRTQMLQRELQAQQDFTVAELFGKPLSAPARQSRALTSSDFAAGTADEGLRAAQHQHPELAGRTLNIDGYWRDGLTLKRVAIGYFLEDDTMTVKVVGDKAQGEAEKTILRRHLVIKPEGNDEYTWRDMGPGCDINIFGRYVHIVALDRSSRLWIDRVGAADGFCFAENELMPAHLLPTEQNTSAKYFPIGGKRNDPGRKYMMAKMGIVDKTMQDVARFQKYDGVVFNFNCVWVSLVCLCRCPPCTNHIVTPSCKTSMVLGLRKGHDAQDDPSLGHTALREFSLKYYMVNDTIEIQEVGSEKNLVKRSQVPPTHPPPSSDSAKEGHIF